MYDGAVAGREVHFRFSMPSRYKPPEHRLLGCARCSYPHAFYSLRVIHSVHPEISRTTLYVNRSGDTHIPCTSSCGRSSYFMRDYCVSWALTGPNDYPRDRGDYDLVTRLHGTVRTWELPHNPEPFIKANLLPPATSTKLTPRI